MKKNSKIFLVGCNPQLLKTMNIYNDVDYMFVGNALHYLCLKDEYFLGKFSDSSVVSLLDIHTRSTRSDNYIQWLKEDNGILKYMQEAHFDIPNSIEFPLDDILGRQGIDYFMCTFAYMIAFAEHQGYNDISIYGANMLYSDDLVQKYNFEGWLLYAIAKGIKVHIQEDSDLLKVPKRYGYEAINTPGVYLSKYRAATIGLIDLGISTLTRDIKSNLDIKDNDKKSLLKVIEQMAGHFDTLYKNSIELKREIIDRHGINIVIDEPEKKSEATVIPEEWHSAYDEDEQDEDEQDEDNESNFAFEANYLDDDE